MTEKNKILLFSPSGALTDESLLDRACKNLGALGFEVNETPQTRLRFQRFAGIENQRAAGITQAVQSSPSALLLASRGGYGLSRLLPQLDFPALADQLNTHQHVLCGHSDITSLQLGLLQAGANPRTLLHGPMACFDFGSEQGVDALTLEHFQRAVFEGKVQIQWQDSQLPDVPTKEHPLLQGPVWGGNLTLLCSLLGTPWMPQIKGGILVLEDVNEPVYRIERMLLQLLQAGVLTAQKAVLLGQFCEPKPGVHDNGYDLTTAAQYVQQQMRETRLLMNFPFGHCTPKACWFQGGEGVLAIGPDQTALLTQALR